MEPVFPPESDLDSLMSALAPEQRGQVELAVLRGERVSQEDLATVAVALARHRQRRALMELPIWVAPMVTLAAVVSFLLEERAFGLFIFLTIFGVLLAIFGGWWIASWRPARRAEERNLALLRGSPVETTAKWGQAAARFVSVLASVWLVLALIGVMLRNVIEVPAAAGTAIFFSVSIVVWLVWNRRRSWR